MNYDNDERFPYVSNSDIVHGLNVYQYRSSKFAIYPRVGDNPEYATLGLVGEAGEIANKVKKIQRDGLDIAEMRADIMSEVGDVFWYLARVADEFGFDLGDAAYGNLRKLGDRKERGVIGGSGDNR